MSDLKKLHHWDVLAIACIDGRFIKRTTEWLTEQTDGVFDLRTEVGASKAILDCGSDWDVCCSVIATSLKLHSVRELYLIDHIDCGAYGGSKKFESEADEKKFHLAQLDKAAKTIVEHYPNILVRKVYADWNEIKFV